MDVTWRKSSYSGGNGGNCIEVGAAAGAGRVLVGDTKTVRDQCWLSIRRRGAGSLTS